MTPRTGSTLVELLVGVALAALLATAIVGAVASGLRMLARLGLRAEAEDIAHLAVEALAFDVRRAGVDPMGAGIEALADARPDRLTLQADLDGDGTVDPASEETTMYVCSASGRKLSRVIGGQSLPLANDVGACGLAYADRTGALLVPPAGGLDGTTRQRVRLVTLDLALAPPGLTAPTTRRASIALRVAP
ncbi:MAG: hypothetical protein ACREQL_15160 [Candidatus Binatia bacterium]